MESLRDGIKSKLDEAIIKNPLIEFKKQRAKVLNLTHTGFETYKNRQGDVFIWDASKRDFRPTKIINGRVKNFLESEKVNKFKEDFFDFIKKNNIDISKVKSDDLVEKCLVRRFNGENQTHLRDYFYETINQLSDKKFDKNNYNYEHGDLNQFFIKLNSLVVQHKSHNERDEKKMEKNENLSIKDRIKAKLDESFISVKDDWRNQKAKIMNLSHMGHGTYKNPAGHEFTWDENKKDFILTKKAEVKPSNVVQFPKKNIMDNPPPGGWREEDKVPLSVNDKIKKTKEYQIKNKELLKTQNVYNMKKGDTFKQIKYGYYTPDSEFGKEEEHTIKKVLNLSDKKVFHTTNYGKFSIPHPEGYKHPEKEIKPIKDRILDKLNLDTDFKEILNDDQFSKTTKFITKDYALQIVDGWDLYFKIYSNPENIGKRGTSIKNTTFVIDYGKNHGSKYAWDKTVIDRLKKEKPKTIEELNSFIERQIQEIKSEEKYFRINKYEDKLKGIDKGIPDFGLEGEYEDIKGNDIYVEFDKPDIVITSNKDEKSAGGFSHPKITIKWHNAKKLNKVKDQLKNAIGLDQINKILQDNGILSKYTNYTDAQFT